MRYDGLFYLEYLSIYINEGSNPDPLYNEKNLWKTIVNWLN